MGAQKVRTNFADIVKEAELADKIKFSEPENVGKNNEDQETQVYKFEYYTFLFIKVSVKIEINKFMIDIDVINEVSLSRFKY